MRTTTSRLAALAALCVLATTISACGEDPAPGGDLPEGECVGESSGDATVSPSYPSPLPGGGEAGIGTVDTGADPNQLNIVLGGDATKAEREAANGLEVGDTFTVKKTTYTLAGFCENKAWLDEATG